MFRPSLALSIDYTNYVQHTYVNVDFWQSCFPTENMAHIHISTAVIFYIHPLCNPGAMRLRIILDSKDTYGIPYICWRAL